MNMPATQVKPIEIAAVNIECLPEKGSQELVVEVSALLERAPTYRIISNQEQMDQGGECLARLREARGNLEKKRVFMKAPSLEAGARVDAMFKPGLEALDAMIKVVSSGTTAYMLAEKKRLEDEERARRAIEQKRLDEEAAARRKAEAEAREKQDRLKRESERKLQEAADLEAAGKKEQAAAALAEAQASEQAAVNVGTQAEAAGQEAAAITQSAAAVVAAPMNVEVRSIGTLGSKTKLKPVMNYRITDIKLVPEQYLIAPEDRLVKALVRANMNANVAIPGIEYFEEFTTSSRASQL